MDPKEELKNSSYKEEVLKLIENSFEQLKESEGMSFEQIINKLKQRESQKNNFVLRMTSCYLM